MKLGCLDTERLYEFRLKGNDFNIAIVNIKYIR